MPSLQLYYAPGACSLAPHILLHESGVPFETTKMGLATGAPESYKKINPKLKVPALTMDGQNITENPAIMTAISQLVPDQNLFGTNDLERVRVYEWLNYLSGTLHGQAFGMVFRPGRFSDDPAMADAIKAKGVKTAQECYTFIESQLPGDGYAVGGKFTVADAYLYVFYRWGVGGLKLDMKEYPKYTAVVQEVEKREAVKKALEAEGLDVVAAKL